MIEFNCVLSSVRCKLMKAICRSEGVYLAMRVCLGGPWLAVGSRYARALADDNTVNLRYRWLHRFYRPPRGNTQHYHDAWAHSTWTRLSIRKLCSAILKVSGCGRSELQRLSDCAATRRRTYNNIHYNSRAARNLPCRAARGDVCHSGSAISLLYKIQTQVRGVQRDATTGNTMRCGTAPRNDFKPSSLRALWEPSLVGC